MTGSSHRGLHDEHERSRRPWLALAAWVGGSFAASAAGAIASTRAPEFYAELVQPAWAPPPGVFGPVWTVLYLLMGIAAWLAWRDGGGWKGPARPALQLYIVQLVLNGLWTWIFFAWHMGALALAEIVLLCVIVGITAVLFHRIRRLAGLLLLPYLAWILFATALTFALWQRNPSLL